MANSKIYLGNTNIGSLFKGASDISIYLGENKVYPLVEPTFKWKASYSDSHVESAQCDSSSEITQNEINLTNLVSVEIGDCVTSIGRYAFISCRSLTSIDIPSGVTSIGNSAFYHCSGFTNLDIPDSVTTIGESTFNGCSGLTSVTIGSGVTTIGDRAFQGCRNLTNIDIPNSVASIGSQTFSICNSLTNVTIGSGVTSINEGAFANNSKLSSVTCLATTPPTLGTQCFYNTPNSLIIYVLDVDAYKSASGWSTYASKIKPISQKPS